MTHIFTVRFLVVLVLDNEEANACAYSITVCLYTHIHYIFVVSIRAETLMKPANRILFTKDLMIGFLVGPLTSTTLD